MAEGARTAFVVVWDEDAAIDLAGRMSEAGWIVAIEHGDGLRAWKRIKDSRPDVLVVDMERRPSHGRELLRTMGQRKHTVDIPVIRIGGEDGVAFDDVVEAASKI